MMSIISFCKLIGVVPLLIIRSCLAETHFASSGGNYVERKAFFSGELRFRSYSLMTSGRLLHQYLDGRWMAEELMGTSCEPVSSRLKYDNQISDVHFWQFIFIGQDIQWCAEWAHDIDGR